MLDFDEANQIILHQSGNSSLRKYILEVLIFDLDKCNPYI